MKTWDLPSPYWCCEIGATFTLKGYQTKTVWQEHFFALCFYRKVDVEKLEQPTLCTRWSDVEVILKIESFFRNLPVFCGTSVTLSPPSSLPPSHPTVQSVKRNRGVCFTLTCSLPIFRPWSTTLVSIDEFEFFFFFFFLLGWSWNFENRTRFPPR